MRDVTYISVYFILSTKSNNVRSNRIIYLQQSTIDYNMFFFCFFKVFLKYVARRKRGKCKIGDGKGGGEVLTASVKGVRWSSMQAFLRSCSITRNTS